MDPLFARYPYFGAAREAVEALDVSLPTLVAEDAPATERGRERVERALLEGTVEPEETRRWEPREELLSYPVARILVSLVDAPAAVEKYAAAEAATARERFTADFEAGDDGLRSTRERLTLEAFLEEFDLTAAVRAEPADRGPGPRRYRVGVETYLTLSDPDWGESWRLVNREVAAGDVFVERQELYRLLGESVRRRVAAGLPFEVRGTPEGEAVAEALEPEVARLRDLLSDRSREYDVDTVVPDLFPPCMKHLLKRARRGAELPPHSRFALTAFLTGIGMDTDEVVRLYRTTSLDEEAIRYQTEYLRDAGGTQYPAPTCATMDAYGDCVNMDDRCATVAHPMSYYGSALEDADESALEDWRDGEPESEA
ncbi:MAG: DNA primase [Salinigranum sp.]